MNQHNQTPPDGSRPEGGFFHRIRINFFESIFRLVRYRAWWVLFVSLMLSTLALYSILDLPIKESLLDLLPQNDPLIEQFKLRNAELQQSDSITILLKLSQPEASIDTGKSLLKDRAINIVQSLTIPSEINSATYLVDPAIATFQRFASNPQEGEKFIQAINNLQAAAAALNNLIGNRLEIYYDSNQYALNFLANTQELETATSLENTQWILDTFSEVNATENALTPILIGRAITLNFESENQLSGSAGCHDYSGHYEINNIRLSLQLAAPQTTSSELSQQSNCASNKAVLDQEKKYLDALQTAEIFFQGTVAAKAETISELVLAEISKFNLGFNQNDDSFDASTTARLIILLQAYNDQLISTLGDFREEDRLGRITQRVSELSDLIDELIQQLQIPVPDFSADGQALRITVVPSQPSYVGLNFNKRVLEITQKTLEANLANEPNIETYIAGAYSFTAESNQVLRQDMFYTTLISIVGIGLIFLLTFRGIIYPLLVIIPLSMGAVWTTAWAKFLLGGFNLVTALLPALLLGLGINYGIHFIGRFVEERQKGKSVTFSVHQAILHKGNAMLSGAITTALVFFIMMLSQSQGLYEMGVVAGFGVIASVMLTLLVLPALTVVVHLVLKRGLRGPVGYRFKLSWFVDGVIKARGWVIFLVLLITIAIIGPASEVRIQFVSEDLMAKGLPTQKAREVIQEAGFEDSNVEGDFFLFFLEREDQTACLEYILKAFFSTPSADEPTLQSPTDKTIECVETTLKKLDLLQDNPEDFDSTIEQVRQIYKSDLVISITSFNNISAQTSVLQVLDLDEQFASGTEFLDIMEENLGEKDELLSKLVSMENTLQTFRIRADELGQRSLRNLLGNMIDQTRSILSELNRLDDTFLENNVGPLRLQLAQLQDTTTNQLSPNNLIEEAREIFQTSNDESMVFVSVSKAIYLDDNYEEFIEVVDIITDNYVGLPMIQNRLEISMERDFWVSTLGAFALIFVSLLIDFMAYRSFKAPFLVMLPLGLGYVWMLGGMGIFNISFNLTNMVISPILIGIGVDNGIHLMHRYLELHNNPDRAKEATESVIMPIVIANLSTIVAFGSMIFANTPGLPVLGKSAIIGVGSVAFCSLTLLPAVLAKRR